MQLKMCRKCGKATPNPTGLCNSCTTKLVSIKRESNRAYDAKHRDKNADAFYHSPDWKRMRLAKLASVGYLCELCVAEYERGERSLDDIQIATDVHHLVPIRVDWSKRLDWDNLQALGDQHHKAVRKR